MAKKKLTKKKILVEVISRVFGPEIIVPALLMGISSYAYLNGYRWRFLTLLFFLDAVLPGVAVVMYFWKRGFKDWDIRSKEQRLPLFLLVVLFHGISVMVAYLIERHPLAEILLIFWLMTVAYALITTQWKISVHVGVNSTLATTMYWLAGPQYLWLFLLPLVVSWARVVDHDHTIPQVIGGALFPLIFISVGFHVLGVV